VNARQLWLSMAKLAADTAVEAHVPMELERYRSWLRKPAKYRKAHPFEFDRASFMFTMEDALGAFMDSWQRMDKEGKAA
jgi:hypothetical protein